MKTISKNLGITKSCPKCNKTIIKAIVFSGNGTFEIKCPHCKQLVQIELGQKMSVLVNSVILGIILLLLASSAIIAGSSYVASLLQ